MGGPVKITFKAGGKDLSNKVRLQGINTTLRANSIPEAEIRLVDGELTTGDFAASAIKELKPGSEVELTLGYLDNEKKAIKAEAFKGLITGQRLKANGQGTELVLQLHGDLIKLVEPRLTKVFKEKSKASDVIGQLIKDGGAKSGKVEATTLQHTQLAIIDQSAWQFIRHQVEANGLLLLPNPKGVDVVDPAKLKGKVHEFKIDAFQSAELELDITSQLDTIQTDAWSIKDQKLLGPAKGSGAGQKGGAMQPADGAKALARKPWDVVGQSPLAKEELTGWSKGEATYRLLDLWKGQVTLSGDAFELGDTVKLASFGKLFQGEYLVTAVRHSVSLKGWQTTLELGFAITRTGFYKGLHQQAPLVKGLLIGTVMPFKEDPEALLRLPVKVPELGSKENIVWARPASPYATKDAGLFLPPKPDDEVVLGWLGDDPRHPVILGSLHNPKNKLPIPYDKEMAKRGLVITKDAMTLLFDEKEKQTTLTGSAEVSLTLHEKDGLAAAQAGNTLTLAKGIAAESEKDIALKAGGNLAVEASGKIQLKGSKTEVQ